MSSMLPQTVCQDYLLQFFISSTQSLLAFNVSGLLGCTKILVQCLEEMPSKSRSALPQKNGVFESLERKRGNFHPENLKDGVSKLSQGYQFPKPAVFWSKVPVLRPFSVMNYRMKVYVWQLSRHTRWVCWRFDYKWIYCFWGVRHLMTPCDELWNCCSGSHFECFYDSR